MKKTEFSSSLLRERYVKLIHASGLPIYVFPKNMATTFAYFAVHYGSENCEREDSAGNILRDPDGVAHFLEHKLFENEDGSDAFERFSGLGSDANAYTSYDRTAYLCSCTENEESVLEALLHFVTHPHFTAESVKKEQGIIGEEIRMYEDNPWERCYQNLLKSLYRRHPVRKNICGTQTSIRQITPELLYDCYNRFYTPQNMVMIVCGNLSPEAVLAVADRALPQEFAHRQTAKKHLPHETGAVFKAYVETEMPISKPIYAIGIKDEVRGETPEERLRLELCRAMLDEILFSRSGSFYNDLFERGILTPSFSSGYSVGEGFAFYSIEGEAEDPQAVFAELKDYLHRIAENGIDEADFERARRVLYADEICTYDSTEEIATRLLTFAFEGTDIFSCPDLLQQITKGELESLLRKTVFDDRFSLSVVLPTA